MNYSTPLISGRLIKRYKRFLADIALDSGEIITAHCANTGSMKHCAEPNSRVWLFDSNNPKRKLRYSWEWVEIAGTFKACINTARANELVYESLATHALGEFTGNYRIIREPKVADGRLDFFLDYQGQKPSVYIEVKSVTLLNELNGSAGMGSFPDAVTERGLKHLERLLALKNEGFRAVLLFCVPHSGITSVCAAHEIDPNYAQALTRVSELGVEVLAYQVSFNEEAYTMQLQNPLPIILN